MLSKVYIVIAQYGPNVESGVIRDVYVDKLDALQACLEHTVQDDVVAYNVVEREVK